MFNHQIILIVFTLFAVNSSFSNNEENNILICNTKTFLINNQARRFTSSINSLNVFSIASDHYTDQESSSASLPIFTFDQKFHTVHDFAINPSGKSICILLKNRLLGSIEYNYFILFYHFNQTNSVVYEGHIKERSSGVKSSKEISFVELNAILHRYVVNSKKTKSPFDLVYPYNISDATIEFESNDLLKFECKTQNSIIKIILRYNESCGTFCVSDVEIINDKL